MLFQVVSFSPNFFWAPKKKPWTIVHGFRPEIENFDFHQKMNSLERASQEKQIDANFSCVAPSSKELGVHKLTSHSNVHAW